MYTLSKRDVVKYLPLIIVYSLFLNPVFSGVYAEKIDSSKYTIKGDKLLSPDSSCNMDGIIKSYANLDFIKNIIPSAKRDDLKKVSYQRSEGKLIFQMKHEQEMICKESSAEGESIVFCRFDKVPVGLNYLWFKVTRNSKGSKCIETFESEGQVSKIVMPLGTIRASIHKEIANALLEPYRESCMKDENTFLVHR